MYNKYATVICSVVGFMVSYLIAFCKGAEFLVSNGTAILLFDTRSPEVEVIFSQGGSEIIGIGADVTDNFLFWSDNSLHHRGIYSSDLRGGNSRLIISDTEVVNGLSVDWASNHIYWTDATKRTVEVANYDGSGRKILFSLSAEERPRSIIADPLLGYIFWADQWHGRIERARLDGQDRESIVSEGVFWPNQLAVSKLFRRLYWIESSDSAAASGIMSCNLDGSDMKQERQLHDITSGMHSFGLAIQGNKAIISTWKNSAIYSTLVGTGTTLSLWKEEISRLGSGKLYSLISIDASLQPAQDLPCSHGNKGGCSHLCLPSGMGRGYTCHCPSYSGLALDDDDKTCTELKSMLLMTYQHSGEVGFVSPEIGTVSQANIVGRSSSPVAVTYDPRHKKIYWSNKESNSSISISSLNGRDKVVFLGEEDGLGYVEGMALDWKGGYLYFTNCGKSSPLLGSKDYEWHWIEMISLDKTIRKTIITHIHQPSTLSVDHDLGLLFITNKGDNPSLTVTNLDGSSPHSLVNGDFLSKPLVVRVHDNFLFIADGTGSMDSSAIIKYNIESATFTTLLKIPMNVLDMTLSESDIYISAIDTKDNQGHMMTLDLLTLEKSPINLQGSIPTSIFFSNTEEILAPYEDPCEEDPCSHICLHVSNQIPGFQCGCPDRTGLILSDNHRACTKPHNMMIVADMNTIRQVSLDTDTYRETNILYYGHLHSNILSIIFDPSTDSIFWIDANKIITMSLAPGGQPEVIYEGDPQSVMDGLSMDDDRQRLYWTTFSSNNLGKVMKMKVRGGLSSVKVVADTIGVPGPTVLHHSRRWIFWAERPSEHNLQDTEGSLHRIHTSGGRNQHTLMRKGLVHPSSLGIYAERLYVADAIGKLIVMDFDGSNQHFLKYLSLGLTGIYGIHFYQNFLFYTNLEEGAVKMIDIETGWNVTMATNLTRPTSILVYHPTSLQDEGECGIHSRHCDHGCVSIPGSYYCTCPPGEVLQQNGFSCRAALLPWEKAHPDDCHATCGSHMTCARLVPTIQFYCVCQPGYHSNNSLCQKCPVDTYKPSLDNTTCLPCDENAITHGMEGATSCSCYDNSIPPFNSQCPKPPADHVTKQPNLSITEAPPSRSHGDKRLSKDKSDVNGTEEQGDDWRYSWNVRKDSFGRIIGLPYFDSCPSGDTLSVDIPAYRSKAKLRITWAAFDFTGKRLSVKSNYRIQNNNLLLEWWANGEEGKQTVVMEAEDAYNQIATCKFYVLVEDKEPPSFLYCPRDISVMSDQLKERVLWSQPEATDNVKVEQVTGTHQSGDSFKKGATVVTYTAADQAGNKGHCNFTVEVFQDSLGCKFPPVHRGAFVCSKVGQERYESCRIVCENMYAVNPLDIFSKTYNCNNTKDINRIKDVLKSQRACLAVRIPTVVTQEFTMWFKGPCEAGDQDLEEELYIAIVMKMQAHSICPSGVCDFGNLTIECDYTETDLNRDKRGYLESILFAVKWNVTIDNSTGISDDNIKAIFTDIKFQLLGILHTINLNLHQRRYTAVRNVKTSERLWSCHLGEIWHKDGCVPCPAGSQYTSDPFEQCHVCPPGSYQPFQSQTSCFSCGGDKTSEPGATTASQCFSSSALNHMSKFIIIATCTFGAVFLITVIILYCQYKKQQKKTATRRSSNVEVKMVKPSTYAPSPPLPRLTAETFPSTRMESPKPSRANEGHLFCNHNYEDMNYDQDMLDSSIYDRRRAEMMAQQSHNCQTLPHPSNGNVMSGNVNCNGQGAYEKSMAGMSGTLPPSLNSAGIYDRSMNQHTNGTPAIDRSLPQLASTVYERGLPPPVLNRDGTLERSIPPLVSGTSLERKLPPLSTMPIYHGDSYGNMSPTMSPPMLGSPVSDHYMYKGEFRNFSPTPRTNSLRSQLRNQALHVYDPPPPPPPPPQPDEYDPSLH